MKWGFFIYLGHDAPSVAFMQCTIFGIHFVYLTNFAFYSRFSQTKSYIIRVIYSCIFVDNVKNILKSAPLSMHAKLLKYAQDVRPQKFVHDICAPYWEMRAGAHTLTRFYRLILTMGRNISIVHILLLPNLLAHSSVFGSLLLF